MTFSLYAATIPTYQQMLDSLAAFITKAEAFCIEKDLAPEDILEARLAPDMYPFARQFVIAYAYSAGAIEGARTGIFHPDMSPPPPSFAALTKLVTDARITMDTVTPEEAESWIGKEVVFAFGKMRMEFIGENFLLSFSQPNFFFHVATAYDILRHRGVTLGKRNFLGKMRFKD